MTSHACPRCGLESRCSRRSWPDRHPVAAVTLAVIVLAMTVAHPWLLGVIAVGGLAYLAHQEQRRRHALAARADWEHQALIAGGVFRETHNTPGQPDLFTQMVEKGVRRGVRPCAPQRVPAAGVPLPAIERPRGFLSEPVKGPLPGYSAAQAVREGVRLAYPPGSTWKRWPSTTPHVARGTHGVSTPAVDVPCAAEGYAKSAYPWQVAANWPTAPTRTR